ncbi:MAG: glycoside hydrolase 5 family protein [Anaerolineae bacterium]
MDLEALRAARWPVEKTAAIAGRAAAVRGCNYIPRHCVNTTAMWQELDEREVDQELGWAAGLGLNSVRVFVQYLVYEHDPDALLERMHRFLDIAASHGISTMWVLLDDCWGSEPALGPQPEPIPGVHNSRWTSSPGDTRRRPEHWPELERYVKGLVGHFSRDERILAWDLYNEPQPASRPLVEQVFSWAREIAPVQPLTACWQTDDLSDLATFHSYAEPSGGQFAQESQAAYASGRPVLCTECLARSFGSTLANILPAMAARKTGFYVWGLVSGSTQTRFPWGWPAGGPEPRVWHHDLLYPDGTPWDESEAKLLRQYARH